MDSQNQIEIIPTPAAPPVIITSSGPAAPERFLEFFAANICDPNTRRAYARQVMRYSAPALHRLHRNHAGPGPDRQVGARRSPNAL